MLESDLSPLILIMLDQNKYTRKSDLKVELILKYCGAFLNSGWLEIVTQGRTKCQEAAHRISARSSGRIENYDCCYKTGQLRILRQNPNLIVFLLPGLYHPPPWRSRFQPMINYLREKSNQSIIVM